MISKSGKSIREIIIYVANLVGLVRLVLTIAPIFYLKDTENSFGAAIFVAALIYIGGWILDWIDGPLARRFNQTSLFGATFDWYLDLLAEVVLLMWCVQIKLWVANLLLITFTFELCASYLDTLYVTLDRQWGDFYQENSIFFSILKIVFPKGKYSAWGTALWIIYPTWICTLCLKECYILSNDSSSSIINVFNFFIYITGATVPFYIWHQFAYCLALARAWVEPCKLQ